MNITEQDIDLFDKYYNKELNEEELKLLNDRLVADTFFKIEFDKYINTYNAIEHYFSYKKQKLIIIDEFNKIKENDFIKYKAINKKIYNFGKHT